MNNWYTEIWKEGKVIDLWSLNHILGGTVLAGIFFFLNLPLTIALILTFLIAILWEIYELIEGIYETHSNKILDVLTSLLGVPMFYYLANENLIETKALFAIFLFSFIILEVWGYLARTSKQNQ
jgi:Na+-transporting methylmalonyl-CoA/oxaloacetate decarboxylase beta subunit